MNLGDSEQFARVTYDYVAVWMDASFVYSHVVIKYKIYLSLVPAAYFMI